MDWPFSENKNVATFTSRQIASGEDWIYYVSHDADDGAWQFHGIAGPCGEDDAVVVALETMLERDPSIGALAGLPLGWHAWRKSEDSEWTTAERI